MEVICVNDEGCRPAGCYGGARTCVTDTDEGAEVFRQMVVTIEAYKSSCATRLLLFTRTAKNLLAATRNVTSPILFKFFQN
jgi:hypothetical protein